MKVASKSTKMSGSYLLDTNIIIAFYEGESKVVEKITGSEIYLLYVVIGELRFGAEKSRRRSANQKQIDALIDQVTILPGSAATAKYYGIIKSQLKKKGRPIPENDIWIAAIVKEYDLILVTRDDHFSHIEGIKQEAW